MEKILVLTFRSIWRPYQDKDKPPYEKFEKFVISNGHFYFSYDFHLTHSLQRQHDLENEIKTKPMWQVRTFFFLHMRNFCAIK